MTALEALVLGLPPTLVYATATAMTLGESAAFVGLLLPGETVLFLTGVLAGLHVVAPLPLALLALGGAVLGDAAGFTLGRRWGPALRGSRLGRRVGEARWDWALETVRRRGVSAVLLGRWVGVLRALVPMTAGMSGLRFRRFLLTEVAGATAWVGVVVGLGYLTAASWSTALPLLAWAGPAVLMAAGVCFTARGLVRRRSSRSSHRATASSDASSPRAGEPVPAGAASLPAVGSTARPGRAPARRPVAVLVLATSLVAAGCDASTAAPRPAPVSLPQRAGPVTGPGCGDATGRVQHVEFDSSSFGEVGDFQIYLPPCYDTEPARRYPVVYLLHGAGHDDEYWLEVGADRAADAEIAARRIDPVILVLPDGGARFEGAAGQMPFEQFLSDELVPRIDGGWRTRADRAHRAIGGISLGGAQALEAAADLPRLFTAVGGHSAVIHGAARLADAFARDGTAVYLDVGSEDSLRRSDEQLSAALDARDLPHVFRVSPGGHVEDYWRAWVPEYLRFYDAALSAG